MKRTLLLVAFLSCISLPAFARETPLLSENSPRGQPAAPASEGLTDSPPEPSARTRTGFYLRSELGLGYRSFSAASVDARATGAGAGASLLLGGTPVPNLVLLGEFAYSSIINPTIHLGGQSVETKDATAGLFGAGPGFIYYFMPANVSLGASFLLTRMTISQNGVKMGETELGYGGAARVGKEWWVGRRVGMGLNGQFTLASMKDKGEGAPTWLATAFTVSALFSYE